MSLFLFVGPKHRQGRNGKRLVRSLVHGCRVGMKRSRRAVRAMLSSRIRDGATAALVQVVDHLRSDPNLVLDAVRAIRTDPERCADVASRSYMHPNGFAKIKLFERPDFSLRLHIWPAGKDRRGDMNPHSHRWAFASWGLLGQGVVETYYKETPLADPNGATFVRCRYRRVKGVEHLKRPRVVRLKEIGEFERPSGGIYACSTDVIHTVDPIGRGLMATVVLQGRTERESAPVYLRSGGADEQRHQPFSAEELRGLLCDLEIAMGAAPRHLPLFSPLERRTVDCSASETVCRRRHVPSSQPPSTADDPFTVLYGTVLRSDRGLHALRSAAEDLRDDPFVLRDSLRTLLLNDEAVERVAVRSSVHANGFAKIVLHVGGGCSVRLHVWHPHNGRWIRDTMPHGHRWEFASWIVIGTLHEITFTEAADGVIYQRLAYRRKADGKQDLAPDGCAPLRTDQTVVHPAGTVYARAHSMIHTATPAGEGLVASLVLQGPRRFDPTPVYIRRGVEPDHDDWPVRPDDVHALVSEVAAALQ